MRFNWLILCLLACSPKNFLFAQDKLNIKFGNVSAKDFATKIYPVDSTADAVVLADVGSSQIEGNTKGWFSLVYKRFKRAHILNKNGYDIANVEIPLYTNGDDEEQLDKLKAVTYNLENGKVVETKLDAKGGVFKDRISKNLVIRKFTFPNVKEGSIIEFEYSITSDFLHNLQPWEFQGAYPRLWSEYNLALPDFFGYVFLTQGYKQYDINTRKPRTESFSIIDGGGVGPSERYQFNSGVVDYRWVMKNIKPLKEESYTSTLNNHVAKIEFQLSEYRQPLTYRRVMGTWEKLADDLMEAEFFGLPVTKDNGWLKDIVRPLTDGAAGPLEKAKNIFGYVRDQFTCTDYSDLYLEQNLRNLVKSRSGSVSEINLLLTAMLRYADINAAPVLLSTRSHGYTYPLYPILSKFNYVVVAANIEGRDYFLDATEPRLGFGRLPARCYNGHARVMGPGAPAVAFNSEDITETTLTSVFIINDENGKWIGSMQQTPGYYSSMSVRDKMKEKGREQLEKDMVKAFGHEIKTMNFRVDSLARLDDVVKIQYDFDMPGLEEDIIYLNPMFGENWKENPFKSALREYPVEMPFALDEIYNLQMEIPNGYVLDELPKSMVVKLNEEGEGVFEYRLSQSGNMISFRSRIKINRTYFMPEEYEMLREFFNLVVKKHAEQIVLKKKT